jgi:hypothetical protein
MGREHAADCAIVAQHVSREDLEKVFIKAERAKQQMRMAGIGWTGLDFYDTATQAIAMLKQRDAARDDVSEPVFKLLQEIAKHHGSMELLVADVAKRNREDQILAMLRQAMTDVKDIRTLVDQESKDLATLKELLTVAAQKVTDAAARMNDAIAILTQGTADPAVLGAIASDLAEHHNSIQAMADAIGQIDATADAEQPPTPAPTPTPDPTPVPDPASSTDPAASTSDAGTGDTGVSSDTPATDSATAG